MFKRKDKNLIKDVVLAVTYQCSSRCQFCNIWKKKETYSSQMIDYQNLPHNLRNVNITGGEPFMREDLSEVIRTVKQRCPKAKIIISTNGFSPALIKKQVQKIIKFKRNIGLAVSLDGFGKNHEDLRKSPGSFCMVLETIRLLKELGIKDLKIAFTLGDHNISQLKRVYQLSKELEVEFSLALYHNSDHYFNKLDNQITKVRQIKKELHWLIDQELKGLSPKKWLRAYFTYGLIKFLETKQRTLPDYSGQSSIFIDPHGNIYPSDVWSLKLGNLRQVRDWNRFKFQNQGMYLSQRSPVNWMICTARQAMKKHWLKVGLWIMKNKIQRIFSRINEGLGREFPLFNVFSSKLLRNIR